MRDCGLDRPCTLNGCDPGTPYLFIGRLVSVTAGKRAVPGSAGAKRREPEVQR